MSHPVSILIIDDDKDLRYFLGQILILYGFTVMEAEHGQDALDILEKSTPSILLIDLDMPVMSGKELILHLVNRPEASLRWGEIPRIAYSARLDLYPEIHSLVHAMFEKPVPADEIVQTVKQLLKLR